MGLKQKIGNWKYYDSYEKSGKGIRHDYINKKGQRVFIVNTDEHLNKSQGWQVYNKAPWSSNNKVSNSDGSFKSAMKIASRYMEKN